MRSCVRSTDTSPNKTSWRFQPIWTIILKLDLVSRGQNKKIFETTNQIIWQNYIPLFVAYTPHWLGHLGLQIWSYQAGPKLPSLPARPSPLIALGWLKDHIGPCSSPCSDDLWAVAVWCRWFLLGGIYTKPEPQFDGWKNPPKQTAEIPTQNQGPHLRSRESYRYILCVYIVWCYIIY